MVEIRFKNNYEVAELAGKSLAELRKEYAGKFGIPEKARIKLNERKVRTSQEAEIRLRDWDDVRFAVEKTGKGALLAGAMLLALAASGGVFAFGFLTNTTTISTISSGGADFATVTANATGAPTATVFGLYKGSISSGNLFVVTPAASYPGDLTVTVSIANADKLAKVYRVFNLLLEVTDVNGNLQDINESGDNLTANDRVLLSMDNGSVNFYLPGNNQFYIRAVSGFYVSSIYTTAHWVTEGAVSPMLYVDVGQR